jgi:hypothetical protein
MMSSDCLCLAMFAESIVSAARQHPGGGQAEQGQGPQQLPPPQSNGPPGQPPARRPVPAQADQPNTTQVQSSAANTVLQSLILFLSGMAFSSESTWVMLVTLIGLGTCHESMQFGTWQPFDRRLSA